MINFNKPYLSGNELKYISEAIAKQKLSGDGFFTKKCQSYFEERYGFLKTIITTSCTHALEMVALLINTEPGDEIIMPSFTFVSTANAFVLRGAKIVFADSSAQNPNIDVSKVEALITAKTKAIVVVHYAGFACDMEALKTICEKHNIILIEDAAHAIDSYYKNKPLGTFGDFATFSFHDTKNITCGEGGMLVINKEKYIERAEIIKEKGTNRTKFYKGEVDKYSWVDIGSSYVLSEINAAFLYGQIENLDFIQEKRKKVWEKYYRQLQPLESTGNIKLPTIPKDASQNGHLFYIICNSQNERDDLINYLRSEGIFAVFHYLPLHLSQYYLSHSEKISLPNAENFAETIIRLPLCVELKEVEQEEIVEKINSFFSKEV